MAAAMDVRSRVLEEIVATERTFVESLRTCIAVFHAPLEAAVGSRCEDVDGPLGRLLKELALLEPFNSALLGELEAEVAGNGNVGRVFRRFAPFLKMFSRYLELYEAWSDDRKSRRRPPGDRDVCAFLVSAASDPRCRSLDLASFLVAPVQRRSIFDPKGELNVLDWPGRRLVRGPLELKKLCRKGPKHFTFWLLSDCLLYAQRYANAAAVAQRGGAGGEGYAYQLNRALPLHSVAVEDTAFATLTQRSLKRAADLLKSSDVVPRDASRSFVVEAPSVAEARDWRDAIDRLRPSPSPGARTRSGPSSAASARRSGRPTAVSKCEACAEPFSVLRRRHHCRDCGACFCRACTPRRVVLPHLHATREHRSCDACLAPPGGAGSPPKHAAAPAPPPAPARRISMPGKGGPPPPLPPRNAASYPPPSAPPPPPRASTTTATTRAATT
ncbi:hypothetical protein JL720_2652 [Aureococcus anophagefferens]|nr:hypothetical protein JL720_2652 [Aureococcus anophagefferens]